MKKIVIGLAMVSVLQLAFGEEPKKSAEDIANDLWKASGGEEWANVQEARFSFVLQQKGKQVLRADHIWNVPAKTDDVTWKDANGNEKHVKVNLADPGNSEDAKAAYARWANDSDCLFSTLKLKDPGVQVKTEPRTEFEGFPCDPLRVSFEKASPSGGVRYVLYLDANSDAVRGWDYTPANGAPIHSTWERYHNFGGFVLATVQKATDKTIRFVDIQISMAK